jgi:hypothetical protein
MTTSRIVGMRVSTPSSSTAAHRSFAALSITSVTWPSEPYLVTTSQPIS